MYRLVYLEQAKQDLLSMKRYIKQESGDAPVAIRFTEKIREQCRHGNCIWKKVSREKETPPPLR